MLAIIGGSGMAMFDELVDRRRQVVRTPFGDPSCPLSFGRIDGHEIVFAETDPATHSIDPW